MIKKILFFVLIAFVTVSSVFGSPSNRKVVRVGYFEAGSYFIHKVMLGEIKGFLAKMKGDDVDIIFEPYGYKSAEWNRDKCRAMAGDLARAKELDLVIAAGPWVVGDLLEAGFDRAIVGIYQFDAETMGLVDGLGRPIAPNLTVNYRPRKIESDMQKLLSLFPEKRIGLLYFASGDEAATVKKKAYEIARKHQASIYTAEKFSNKGIYTFFGSFENIRRAVDVLYITPLWGMELDQMRQFFIETQHQRVPTFTSEGYLILEKGATASNCLHPYRARAKFTAYKILEIINGASPSSLPTVFEDIPGLCLNLESAKRLNVTFARRYLDDAWTIASPPAEIDPRYTLADAIGQAERESAGVLLVQERYQRAVTEAQRAFSSYLPHINLGLSAAAADNEREASVYNESLNRKFAADLVLDQKLLSFPAIKAIQTAKKNRAIESVNLKKATRDLVHAVVVAYLSVLEKEDGVVALEGHVDNLRKYFELAIAGYRIGLADTLDVQLLEHKLIVARIELSQAQGELKIARIILNVLLNRPGDDAVILDREAFSEEIMVLMAQKFQEYTTDENRQRKFEQYLLEVGMNNSIDLEVAALKIGIQRDLLSAHRKRFFPEISLRAKYSYSREFEPGFSERDDSWTIGGFLNLPILSGSEWKYNGKILKAELSELQYKKDSIRFHTFQDITSQSDRFAALINIL
ncbi:MAG: TolC family protein, partial [Candidatus Zixiibacteriota bacterium]